MSGIGAIEPSSCRRVNAYSCPIPLKKSVFEWNATARGGVVAEVKEKLLPHVAKSGDGIGISLASLRRF
jgi:hypothetical protein